VNNPASFVPAFLFSYNFTVVGPSFTRSCSSARNASVSVDELLSQSSYRQQREFVASVANRFVVVDDC